jgi:hypothetical protein
VAGKKNRIIDLKNASKGINQKNKFCRDNLKKKLLQGDNAKLSYFADGKDLLTQKVIGVFDNEM